MTLRAQALGAVQAIEAAKVSERDERDSKRNADGQEMLAAYFTDDPVLILETESGEVPVEKGDTWSKRIERAHVTTYRFQVDGVVFRWVFRTDDHVYKEAGRWYIEVECSQCRRGTDHGSNNLRMALISVPWVESRREAPDNMREYYASDDYRRKVVAAIGQALRTPSLCYDCGVGVPMTCPSCGRSNP